MENEILRMQMLSGVITESEYKAIINKEIEDAEKSSLNESMIGGIVGIGAINQIPSRAKADYETSFEHFLGERYETKFENREQDPQIMNEADKVVAVGEKVEAAVKDKLEATVINLSDPQRAQLKKELDNAGITANSKIEDVAGKLDESLFEGEGDPKQKVASALSNIGGGLMKSMLVPLIPLIVGQTTGTGFGGGLAITAGVAGALIALAKLLGEKYSLNEVEKVNENMYYHVLEDGGNGNIGHQGVYDTQEEAQNIANELTDMFPNSEFYVEASASEDEPYNVTSSDYDPDKDFNEGKEVEELSLYEGEVNEGKLDGLYMELKDVLFPYYTDLTGKERVDMINDVIKELNSYILILQDEKKAKQ